MRGHISSADEGNYYEEKSNRATAESIRESIEFDFDSPRFKRSVYEFNDLIHKMESTLKESKWLAGNEISLADIDVVPYIWHLHTL